DRVLAFSEEGAFVRQFGGEGDGPGEFNGPAALDVDAAGDDWVADERNERIEQVEQSGKIIAKFGSEGSGPGAIELGFPMGLLAGPDGAIWVSDSPDDRVQKWILASSSDTQEVISTYDTLGRITSYEDADGNRATTTYDLLGRPFTMNDG